MAKQVDVNIAAHNIQIVVVIEHDALNRGLPCLVVGVHPWDQGDVESDSRSNSSIVADIYGGDLSSTISQEQSGRTSGGVAGELKALPEAVRPYPKGVGEADVPTLGVAVSQGGSGRDMQEPTTPSSDSMGSGPCPRHSGREHQEKQHANYHGTGGGAHPCAVVVVVCVFLGKAHCVVL